MYVPAVASPKLPDLRTTGRRYVEHTQRARLGSPGLERFDRPGRGNKRKLALGALLVAALVALFVYLTRTGG